MAIPVIYDWFLRDWLSTLGISQADLDRKTEWGRRKTSELVNGKQRYNRDTLNEAAQCLNIEPFELLMHPEDAMFIRGVNRKLGVAAENRSPFTAQPRFERLDIDDKKAG